MMHLSGQRLTRFGTGDLPAEKVPVEGGRGVDVRGVELDPAGEAGKALGGLGIGGGVGHQWLLCVSSCMSRDILTFHDGRPTGTQRTTPILLS